jgi:putative transposase
VARLRRSADLVGISRRKGFKTTVRDRDARPAPDRVQRCFTAERPDRLWVADITYVPTLAGFLFLAVVMDVCSRRIVGWAMATHLRAVHIHCFRSALQGGWHTTLHGFGRRLFR